MLTVEEPLTPLPDQIGANLPALVAYVDRNQRFRFVSRQFEQRFGVRAEEVRGKRLREVLSEEAYAAVRPYVEAVLQGHEQHFQAMMPDAAGAPHLVEVRYSPHRDANGAVLGYYSLAVDVSETERRAREQRDRDLQLDMAMEASGLGAWSYDVGSQSVELSSRAADIFGLGGEQVASWARCSSLIHPDDLPRRLAVAEQALRDGRPFEVEYRVRRPVDGVEIWVHTRGRARHGADGKPTGLLGVLSDISRQKAVEVQLRADRERLEELERTQSFLLRLADALRQEGDPRIITGTAAQMLGELLGAARVGYGEVDEALASLMIPRDWTRGVPSLAGRYPLPEFGEDIAVTLRAGHSLVIEDIATDPRTASPFAQDMFRGMGVAATISTPLVRDGRARALLFVHHDAPRQWTEGEVRIVEAVAERVWAALQRARTETSLRESEARFRIMADSAPAPVWVTGAAGGIDFVNQAFADYAGAKREQMLGHAWTGLMHPEDLPAVIEERDRAMTERRDFTFEARFRRHDGEQRWMQATSKARFDEDRRFMGYVGIAMDMTEVRKVEAALRESEARFRRIAEDAPVMMWICDVAGKPVYVNRMQRDFFGIGDDLETFDWNQAVYAEDRAAMQSRFAAGLARQQPFWSEGRFNRFDGDVRSLFTRAAPRFDVDGRFLGAIGVHVDVTDSRRAETHQQLLINELNHRVKNTLATVQSIAHQTLREGVMTRDARHLFTSRLLALSAAHNVLTRENWDSAELREIVAEAIRAHEDPTRARIAYGGPQVRVGPKQALAISMALHELATNAGKYGALSGAAGGVDIVWRIAPARDVLTLSWRESGGPPVTPPSRKGFGSRLLNQGLAIELGVAAELDYAPDGLSCLIKAPLG